MSKLIMIISILAFSTNAFPAQIFCKIKVNTELVFKTQFDETNKKTILGKYGDYQISLVNKGHLNYEIEAYNNEIPSRTYALGNLNTVSNKISLDLWTRDVLLQSSCEKINE
ncbi:hypothetical protein N9W41_00155 [bacterium]|nr:hypothetical protein [bacterium]MDB2425936.1 hypothetical protein [bacterium]